jgi:hypothetical protein
MDLDFFMSFMGVELGGIDSKGKNDADEKS